MGTKRIPAAGFSLIESLIALTLALFIVLAGLEIFGSARQVLFELETVQSAREGVAAAIERIRSDVRGAGRGLAGPPGAEIVKALESTEGSLVMRCGETSTSLASDAAAGQRSLAVVDGRSFPAGRTICLLDAVKGETAVIASGGMETLTLSAPIAGAYGRSGSTVVLVQKIAFYLDAAQSVLRRRVDAGAGQPLLEDVLSFSYRIESPSPVVVLAVGSKLAAEVIHEASIHAKNAALCVRR
jgi:hypothetical protein